MFLALISITFTPARTFHPVVLETGALARGNRCRLVRSPICNKWLARARMATLAKSEERDKTRLTSIAGMVAETHAKEDNELTWSYEKWFGPDSVVSKIALQQEALDNETRIKGPKHPDTLESKRALAKLFSTLGNFRIPEKLHRSILRRNMDSHGKNHPYTLSSMSDLAEALRLLGDLDGVVKLQRIVVEIKRNTKGLRNADTLSSMIDLACSLKEVGDLKGPMELWADVFYRKREVHGISHKDTIAAKSSLVQCVKEYIELEGLNKSEALQLVMESFRGSSDVKSIDAVALQLNRREPNGSYRQGNAPLLEGMNRTTIEDMVQQRVHARMKRNFKTADRLQQALQDMGITINDRTKTWNVKQSNYKSREGGKQRWQSYVLGSGSLTNGMDEVAIAAKVEERLEAKFMRDFEKADTIEEELRAMGILLDDRRKVWNILS